MPTRYKLRCGFHRAEGVHSMQVSIPCPLVVDRAKKAAAAHHFIGRDNSRVGFGATIPKARLSLGLEKLGRDLGQATLRLSGCPIQQSDLILGQNLRRRGSDLTGFDLARLRADQHATSDERRLSCCSLMKLNVTIYLS
jgi:hypothetical protein